MENKNISVLELFGGIGACTKALKNIGMNVNVVDYVEIDKYACKSYNAINGTNFEPQDIKEWDKDINIDLIMHGSPCQDFSVAGKQAGGDLGSGTRSSLMYETIRIVGKLRPKYVVWENVKNLLSKKHKHNFDAYIETMNILGYNSYYQVLNAKDYGIPQNRERVYTISIRKDIDKGNFKFPEKEELKLRLKDMLEDKVDEKYYLSDEKITKIQNSNFMQEKKRIQDKDYSDTILARDWKDPKCVRIGGIFDTENSKHQAGSIYDKEGLSPTLDVMQGGWRQPSIVTLGNYMPSGHDASRIVDSDGLAPTVKENHGTVTAIVEEDDIEKDIDNPLKGISGQSWQFEQNVYSEDSKLIRTIKAGGGSGNIPKVIESNIKQQVVDEINRNANHQSEMVQTENDVSRTVCATPHATTGQMLQTIVSEEKDKNMKEQLCDYLVENNMVEPYDVINHGYTDHRFETINQGKDLVMSKNMAPIITTRPDELGVAVENEGTIIGSKREHAYTSNDGIVPTLTSGMGTGGGNIPMHNIGLRIRKLTPKECWRLMGFDDEDFEKAEKVNSNTQLYKQAGNSIVVNVLEKIFLNLFKGD